MAERGDYFVQSLARGLAVVRAFDDRHPRLTLSDVARRCAMTRATARRFVLTLTDLGYLRAEGNTFELTPKVLELGYAYLSGLSLAQIAAPHLKELVARLNRTASLCLLDGGHVVNVVRVPSNRIIRDNHSVGSRSPAHATAAGRVLLAALPVGGPLPLPDAMPALTPKTLTTRELVEAELVRVRQDGWALVEQELAEGLRFLAVPVRDRDGQVVAAANLNCSQVGPDASDQECLDALRSTVEHIEAELRLTGGRPA
ncbi:IclR family transcriptional regulator domain-containing protein [Actinacidiphila reveromycinica]|nr:IclR family transcriptional regulator C-terminal domain-containing protein [Streptomyces sp. SN-593]